MKKKVYFFSACIRVYLTFAVFYLFNNRSSCSVLCGNILLVTYSLVNHESTKRGRCFSILSIHLLGWRTCLYTSAFISAHLLVLVHFCWNGLHIYFFCDHCCHFDFHSHWFFGPYNYCNYGVVENFQSVCVDFTNLQFDF